MLETLGDLFQTRYLLLGLGIGGIYALLGQGLVLIYRGSGVLNFAHGAFAMLGAFVFEELFVQNEVPKWPAVILAVIIVAGVGAAVDVLVMQRLKEASALARVIATLGVLIVLQGYAGIRYEGGTRTASEVLPADTVELLGTTLNRDRLIVVVIAGVLTVALAAVYRYTRVGLATTAVAENQRAAAALGWSPNVLSTLNWTTGAALAGLAGVVLPQLISTFTVGTFTPLAIAALAAALIGGFTSFGATFFGGVLLGVAETAIDSEIRTDGAAEALPLLVIVVVLVLRGTSLPIRGQALTRLPQLGRGLIRPLVIVPVVAVTGLLIMTVFSAELVNAVAVSIGVAIILLSLVVLAGYTGQLSLGQFALAGLGALIAARLVLEPLTAPAPGADPLGFTVAETQLGGWGWPFELAVLAAVIGTIPFGLLFALPALRTRGVNLAVVTLGLGVALQEAVFLRGSLTRGTDALEVPDPSIFGWELTGSDGRRFALFALLAFALAAMAVANLRRGRSGRRLIAVRTNERAAASLGINVLGAKLHAFGLSAAVAGLGGVVLAFRSTTINFATLFNPFQSITAAAYAVIGGIGYVIGPPFGATLANGGLGTFIGDTWLDTISEWLPVIGGVALLLLLIIDPNGMASSNTHAVRRLLERLPSRPSRRQEPAATVGDTATHRVCPAALDVNGLGVRFGGVVALDEVGLRVEPGEVVGLIGPNGAGKTTLIDAVSGFVRPSSGTISYDGRTVAGLRAYRRSRAGLSRSFQSLELFDDVTVLENLQAASDDRRGWTMVTDLVHPGAPPLPAAAVAAVREFGLEAELDRRPDELPYGRRRLVGIARAVATEPSVLMLDEPAAGLDDRESAELARLVRSLADEWGIGILLIEHDMGFVMNVCNRVVVLDFGRQIAEGSPEQIQRDPAVVAAYLGEPAGTGDGAEAVAASPGEDR